MEGERSRGTFSRRSNKGGKGCENLLDASNAKPVVVGVFWGKPMSSYLLFLKPVELLVKAVSWNVC